MNADLRRASLHSANLSQAAIAGPETSFSGTKLNARTCWPKGLAVEQLDELLNGTVVERYIDPKNGDILTVREDIKQDPVFGGQQAPDCFLWENGQRVHPEWKPQE